MRAFTIVLAIALPAAALPVAIASAPYVAHADPPPSVADLDVRALPSQHPLALAAGESRVLRVHMQNIGPNEASGVTVSITMPSNVMVESATTADGAYANGVWTLPDPVVANGPFKLLELTVARTAPGDSEVAVEVASSDSSDPDSTPGNASSTTTPEDDEATVAIHMPVDRYAAVGGMTTGECRTPLTACQLRRAATAVGVARPGDTVHVASGDYDLGTTSLQLDGEVSLLGPPNGAKPRLFGEVDGSLLFLSNLDQRLADLEIVNTALTDRATAVYVNNVAVGASVFERLAVRSTGVGLQLAGQVTVRDSVVVGNSATNAAVVAFDDSTLDHVTVIGGEGGAILYSAPFHLHLTLTGSIARSSGPADVRTSDDGHIAASSSNYGTTDDPDHDRITPPGTGGNQTAMPVFVDAAGGDFHQAVGSPTIDAATDVPAADRRDVDGGLRVYGAAPDIGADEFGPWPTTTTVTTSPNPSVFGQTVTITANVTSVGPIAPAGLVRFDDGSSPLASSPVDNGRATTTSGSLVPGEHTITASYQPGDGPAHESSEGTTTHTVNRAATTTTITSNSPDPSTPGQPYAVTVEVAVVAPGAGTVSGSVTVPDGAGGSCTVVALIEGAGACDMTSPSAGTKTLIAEYAGDVNFTGSTSPGVTHQVTGGNLHVSSDALPAAEAGAAYSAVITVDGAVGTVHAGVTEGALPPGLELNSSPGAATLSVAAASGQVRLAGTPSAPGAYDFTVTIQDDMGSSAARSIHLDVAPALTIVTDALPVGRVGESYAASVNITGGVAPTSISVVTGDLPPGVAIASDGSIAGRPTVAGSSAFTVRATSAAGGVVERDLSITIAMATSTPTSPPTSADDAGGPMPVGLPATGIDTALLVLIAMVVLLAGAATLIARRWTVGVRR